MNRVYAPPATMDTRAYGFTKPLECAIDEHQYDTGCNIHFWCVHRQLFKCMHLQTAEFNIDYFPAFQLSGMPTTDSLL
jgi:hypothetical protein